MEIFVKDFSGTTRPRILKFGTNIRYDRLYCVSKNQPHMAYQSLYLSIFLWFKQYFISIQEYEQHIYIYIHTGYIRI